MCMLYYRDIKISREAQFPMSIKYVHSYIMEAMVRMITPMSQGKNSNHPELSNTRNEVFPRTSINGENMLTS